MREIKFRQMINGKFHYWGFINGLFVSPMVITGDNPVNVESNQYTGLQDKNGKEIYEGDIVLVLDRDWPSGNYTNQSPEEYMRSIASTCKVNFNFGRFILVEIRGHDHFYDHVYISPGRDIYEVIGNIHENQPPSNG